MEDKKPEFDIKLQEGSQGWVVTLRVNGKLEFNGSPYTTPDKAITKCLEKITEIMKGENALRDKLLKAFPASQSGKASPLENTQRKSGSPHQIV